MNVEKRQRIERRIAREAIKGLLAEGYSSIYDRIPTADMAFRATI